jgi:hypothetical protein
MANSPNAVVLLGTQRFNPSLAAAVSKQFITGRVALITAGWQEREAEDEDLREHLAPRETVNLELYKRAEQVFRDDPELRDAHSERQEALRHRQDFYRIRVEQALEAERIIRKRPAPPDIAREQRQASIDAIRELDAWHLANCARLHADFEKRWTPSRRPALVKHRREIASIVKGCAAVAIAGGHVATLINRLFLFGIAEVVREKTIFAWSAGAMAVTDRVVLFHDDPPQGPGASEVLDKGMGLVPQVVALPQPEQRLRLADTDRVRIMAQRFAPAICLALPSSASVVCRDGQFSRAEGALELREDGSSGALK